MTEQIEQWNRIKFCIKLEHSSTETIWKSQKATATSNWWLAASSQQCACSCSTSYELFGKTSNHPGNSAPLQPRFGSLTLLAFPETKITFERDETSDCQWDSGKYVEAIDDDWENYVRSQGAYFEGGWGIIVLCTMFFVSCIFFNKCLYFSYFTWQDTFYTNLTYWLVDGIFALQRIFYRHTLPLVIGGPLRSWTTLNN